MPTFPGTAALRRGRVSIPGQAYFLTTVVRERRPLFMEHDTARRACRVIHDNKTWADASCVAWVLMPDHWHGLVQLGDLPLSTLMSRFKASVARAAGMGTIWQKGFHDRALRNDETLLAAARYLVANPLRAGLVTRVHDYSYWNAVWL